MPSNAEQVHEQNQSRRRSSAHSITQQQIPVSEYGFDAQAPGPSQGVDDYAYVNIGGGYPQLYDQNSYVPSTSPLLSSGSQVETPMRWLADNVGTNPRSELWMMMDMDFAKDYSNPPFQDHR